MSRIHDFDVSHAAESVPLPETPGLPKRIFHVENRSASVEEPQPNEEEVSVEAMPNNNDQSLGQAHERTDVVSTELLSDEDPLSLNQHKKLNVSQRQLKIEHPKANKRSLKKFYTRQNDLIDKFLQSGDEERNAVLDMEQNGPKIKFAIYASSGVNFCLFIIQMYAAISTGSLSLFATAADAFVGHQKF
jgi:hypothetical protein